MQISAGTAETSNQAWLPWAQSLLSQAASDTAIQQKNKHLELTFSMSAGRENFLEA